MRARVIVYLKSGEEFAGLLEDTENVEDDVIGLTYALSESPWIRFPMPDGEHLIIPAGNVRYFATETESN